MPERAAPEARKLPPPRTTTLHRYPWDRKEGESDDAWQAFVEYRDLGLSRTVRRAAEILGKSESHLNGYSYRFSWRERVNAFEEHLDHHRQDEHEKAVRDMTKDHALASGYMLRKAMQVIQNTPASEIGVREAIAMFRAAVPIERLSREADRAWNESYARALGEMSDE